MGSGLSFVDPQLRHLPTTPTAFFFGIPCLLDRRTRMVAIRAEHTAISFFRPKYGMTRRTLPKVLTRIRGHGLLRLVATLRTRDGRFEDGGKCRCFCEHSLDDLRYMVDSKAPSRRRKYLSKFNCAFSRAWGAKKCTINFSHLLSRSKPGFRTSSRAVKRQTGSPPACPSPP